MMIAKVGSNFSFQGYKMKDSQNSSESVKNLLELGNAEDFHDFIKDVDKASGQGTALISIVDGAKEEGENVKYLVIEDATLAEPIKEKLDYTTSTPNDSLYSGARNSRAIALKQAIKRYFEAREDHGVKVNSYLRNLFAGTLDLGSNWNNWKNL